MRTEVSIAVLVASVVVAGTAFAHTFGSAMAYQQRDGVTAEPTDVTVTDDALVVTYAATNPLERPVELRSVTLVVYDGPPPFDDRTELTVRRGERLADGDVTLPAGETRSVTVRAPLAVDRERARAAVANGSATPSGGFEARLDGVSFRLEVTPDE